MKDHKIVLDAYEKKIENDEDYIPVSLKEKNRIEAIIRAAKKNRNISLRITDYDLEKIREKASHEGIPYQTLINQVLHKYVTNQLYDENDFLKTIKLYSSGALSVREKVPVYHAKKK
jgi:predicted DNA binding CopG/RHH family protein